MSNSTSPAFPPSTSSPPNFPASLHDRLKSKLAPFRDAAIGYVEGLQVVSDRVISNITVREMDDLSLHDYYEETENDTTFYALSYQKKRSNDDKIWSEELDEDLRLPAFFTSNCSKVVYCLVSQVRNILEDDPEFDRASWSREYIDPEQIFFDVTENGDQSKSPLPFLAHDFITITCKDKQRFVLDVTGDQFGIEGWFYTKKDYWKLLLEGRFPAIVSEAAKRASVEEEDSRNPALRSGVEETLEEIKAEWAQQGIPWSNIYLLSEEKQDQLRDSVAAKVRAKTIAVLSG